MAAYNAFVNVRAGQLDVELMQVRAPANGRPARKALMLLAPICSVTNDTMFCRDASSESDQTRVGELGVA